MKLLKVLFVCLFFTLTIRYGQAQTVTELQSNYSGTTSWDAGSGTLSFNTTGTIYFASKVGNGTNPQTDQMQNFWDVPTQVKKIIIKEGVTVTGAFHTFATCTIEGENRYTSIVYGTPLQRWADANNPGGQDLSEWYYAQFQNYGGTLTIKNLTSLNPFSYHIRGWGTVNHVENCDIIDTRGGSQNHSDGFSGGDGSTVNNCYFETGDDVFKAYFDNTITNCTINMVDNAVPIQLGWGDYSNGAVCNFYNLTIYGTSGRWSPNKTNGVIVGRTGKYTVTINIDGLKLENPNAHLVMLWQENMTLNGAITNADIKVKAYTQSAYNLGKVNLTVCGGTTQSGTYNCVVPGVPVPDTIQAEDYNGFSGITTETTSDSWGDKNLTGIDSLDWVDYDIIAESGGEYTLKFRVASATKDVYFDIMRDTKLLGTVKSPATGAANIWRTDSIIVPILQGGQTIRLVARGEDWKLNWIDFESNPVLPNISDLQAVYKSDSSINLYWTENIADETGFIVERTVAGDDVYIQVDTAAANATMYTDTTALEPFTLYAYRIRTLYDGIRSQPTDSVLARTNVMQHASMPTPWMNMTIGDSMAMASTSTFSNDTFYIDAGDGDFWTSKDRGHFIYQPVSGDCEIISHLVDYEHVQAFTMAGIMIRDSLDAGSKFAAMMLMSDPGRIMRDRKETDGEVYQEFGATGEKAPYWLRLKRIGDVFTGYISADGIQWKLVRTVTIPMDADVYIGMVASSHTIQSTANFSFTDVKVGTPSTEYTISASAGTGGTISPSGSVLVLEGSDLSFSITPNTNYIIEDVTLDGASQGAVATVTLSDISAAHTVVASFKHYDVSVNQIDEDAIKVYPNPAHDVVVVELPADGQGTIRIYSVHGQQITGTKIAGQQTSIDVSQLPKGIYLIDIQVDDFHQTRRVVIE